MPKQAILNLKETVDCFLEKWTRKMLRAGYLERAASKRRDGVLSYKWFLEPLWERLDSDQPVPDFIQTIRNDGTWTDTLVRTAHSHRFQGIPADRFIGCFKILVQAVVECILEMARTAEVKLAALNIIRDYADAFETILLTDWAALKPQEKQNRPDEITRPLPLAKNQYENIPAPIPDLVLVMDERGAILEYNQAAEDFFALNPQKNIDGLKGRIFWNVFHLEAENIEDLLRYYPINLSHQISIFSDSVFLEFCVLPLKAISPASTYFLIILTDVTCHVERGEALEREKQQLREMQITLRNVLGNINQEIEHYKSDLAQTIQKALLPAVEKIRSDQIKKMHKFYLDILRDQLLKLAGSDQQYDPLLLKLTPTEIKICRLVQVGNTTKDISQALNLSIGTIQTHRKNIRKKLKLQNRRINLYTYLVSEKMNF